MFPLKDTQPSRSTPIVTYAIIAINVLVFYFETSLSPHQLERVIKLFGLVPAHYTEMGRWHAGLFVALVPWISHMFLHGGWMHLIGNMWTLWIFGDNVEDRMGKLNFLIFYLVCGLAAALMQFWVHPDADIPMVGASGAISGIMGAYFLMFPRSWILMFVPVFFFPWFFAIPAQLYLLYWFLLQWISGSVTLIFQPTGGGVAWWAHIGGFIAGLVLCKFFIRDRFRWNYPRNYCWRCREV